MDRIEAVNAQLDLESLRAELRKLPRKRVRALAISAGLATSTVEKFRLGHITEPRLGKLQALEAALHAKAAEDAAIAKADTGHRRRKTDKAGR